MPRFTLQDVEGRRRKHPGEFEIPPASARARLLTGDVAVVVVLGTDRRGRPAGERVRVRVEGRSGTGYHGRVLSPIRVLAAPRPGAALPFAPRHVIALGARPNPGPGGVRAADALALARLESYGTRLKPAVRARLLVEPGVELKVLRSGWVVVAVPNAANGWLQENVMHLAQEYGAALMPFDAFPGLQVFVFPKPEPRSNPRGRRRR